MGTVGCFVLPGNYHDIAQVADSHSPGFIHTGNADRSLLRRLLITNVLLICVNRGI